MKTLTFQITDEAFELMKKIGRGSAEYRDSEWSTLEEFKKSDVYNTHGKTEEWFLNRNFGGTYHLIDELYKYGLVDSDGESWHMTYILTDFAKELMS